MKIENQSLVYNEMGRKRMQSHPTFAPRHSSLGISPAMSKTRSNDIRHDRRQDQDVVPLFLVNEVCIVL